jgi:hypothetical protein
MVNTQNIGNNGNRRGQQQVVGGTENIKITMSLPDEMQPKHQGLLKGKG